MKNKRLTYIVLVILFSSQSPGPHAFINSVVQALGQIVAKNAEVNGVAVSSGTTLFDNSLVETGEDSAFIHISNGSVVEMGKQSSAHFEKTELNTIKIELLRGALRFQEEGGRTVTVPDPTKSPPDQLEEAEPGEGLVAVLTRDAFKGVTILNVNETSRIAPTSPILIVSPDGTNKEIHYIKTVKKQTIEMTAGLQLPFPTESLVYQGSRIDPAVATGTPIVGTVVASGGKGVSKTAVLLIALGGGAAAGAAVAFSNSGGDGGGAPPATQVTP